jgi:AraC-like DNA-binding protein
MYLRNLQKTCQLLYFALYHECLEDHELLPTAKSDTIQLRKEGHIDDPAPQTGLYRPLPLFIHMNKIMESITNGNREKLIYYLKTFPGGTIPVFSKQPIRNIKNHVIKVASVIVGATIKGGMDWETAIKLSNQYILAVDELKTENEILELFHNMLFDYVDRMSALNQNHSTITIKCKNYITEHVYEKLSVLRIAENLNVNSNYLSNLFKKEVGLALTDYIHKEKIEIAKQLAISSDHSLTEIYMRLGFNDQSHFTKVFKKIAGVTPREYRMMYKYV